MNIKKDIRVNAKLHEKVKDIAAKEGKGVQRTAEELLDFAISKYYANELLERSNLEVILNNRMIKFEEQLNKTTERLAALMARVGIDNSMGLMGVIVLLEKLLKEDPKAVQDELRKRGVVYFTTAVKEDKEKKKEKSK